MKTLYTVYSDKNGDIEYISSFENEQDAKNMVQEDIENYFYVKENFDSDGYFI